MSNLLQIKNISKEYSGESILSDINFCVGEKKRIGIIGRNGAGKSTLFKIITGEIKRSGGEIVVFDKTRIGYIDQDDDFCEGEVVINFLIRKSGKEDWRCRKMAANFQIKGDLIEREIERLSGGYRMRIKLIAMLLGEPNLLMLDEPTNYLDLSTILLLEKFLSSYKGAYLIISHDKDFLNSLCKEIIEIEDGYAYYFKGSLEAFFVFKREKLKSGRRFNKKQDAKIKHLQSFVDRFRYKASKAKQAQSKLKQIEKIEKQESAKKLKKVFLQTSEISARSALALRIENLSIGYGKKEIARVIEMDIEQGEHIAILGDNGEGKTTFMRTLAGDLEKISGKLRWMPNVKIAYYAQHLVDALDFKEKVGTYLERKAKLKTREDIIKVAANLLFSESDLEKTISLLSGGEKARLCLAGLLLSGANAILLDEPTNHLDFDTVEVLIQTLEKSKATILFISHNRTFINRLADKIMEVHGGKIERFASDYDDYVYSLKEKNGIRTEKKNPLKTDEAKREKREIYEENKLIKRQIEKIEKKLDKNDKRKKEIIKIFTDNPVASNPELSQELKELEKEKINLENDWLEENSKI